MFTIGRGKKKHDIRWNNRVLRQIVGNWNEETDQMCAVNTWLVESIFSSIIKMLKMTCRIVVVVEDGGSDAYYHDHSPKNGHSQML